MTSKEIFDKIISIMSYDNQFDYSDVVTEKDFKRAEPSIIKMVEQGFFHEEDPEDLDSSFWLLAGGEEGEMETFFGDTPELRNMRDVLEDIWERS
ncbi:hypothetical phage protein [Shigella phage Ag3]|uniref:Hypothetical phage protein n=1 Tax=Shigella phage Ag3 TaxID=637730 RepID=C8XUM9_9CAUD|nr:hypothetical protein phiSboM-AG3_gp125 [Shigella phage Ag3]ACO94359.1 hypothetical phage protein [Shigella phage Ag3]